MSTTTPLTDAINALTTYSNSVTGASDTDLSSAVATLAAGYGGGGGGGGGEECLIAKVTPSETVQTITIDTDSFELSTYYAVFVYSTNSGNDPTHHTLISGGSYHLPHTEMGHASAIFGRITERKPGSGSDYWHNAYITVSQSGTIVSVTGNATYAWFMGGVEYSIYIQNINAWESR